MVNPNNKEKIDTHYYVKIKKLNIKSFASLGLAGAKYNNKRIKELEADNKKILGLEIANQKLQEDMNKMKFLIKELIDGNN